MAVRRALAPVELGGRAVYRHVHAELRGLAAVDLLRRLTGARPDLPMTYAEFERRAQEAMSEQIWSYVAGGAGDERTQRAKLEAFQRWALVPRMLAGASDRDLSVELFGRTFPTPLMFAPVGVIGVGRRRVALGGVAAQSRRPPVPANGC